MWPMSLPGAARLCVFWCVPSSPHGKSRAVSPSKACRAILLNPEPLRSAIAGCDALMHVAADYRLWVTDPEKMYAINVTGTRELLRIAREEKVRRVVYTSSVATMGFDSAGTIVDEQTPVSLDNMVGHYKRSKYLAEQEALSAARAGQQVMILNPTTPIGSNDVKPTPTGQIVVDFLNRKFPAYMDTGLNLVDVSEVARTHADALEKGACGERYILGGENLTLKQILDQMAALTGLPSPTIQVPHAVAMIFALFDQTITGRIRGRDAAGDRRGSAHGQEEDVRILCQSGAGIGLPRGSGSYRFARRRSIGFGRMDTRPPHEQIRHHHGIPRGT